jgi:hypothetical protein
VRAPLNADQDSHALAGAPEQHDAAPTLAASRVVKEIRLPRGLVTGAMGIAEGIRAARVIIAGGTGGTIAARPAAAVTAAIRAAPARIV